ncbi:hypothetical protein OE88DRAFT_1597341, partial [Heliocybe sulcata]
VKSAEDLPPPRERKGLKPVSPPGSNVDFNTFIYRMAAVGLLVFAFYGYRLWNWKLEAGSWWNLATGKKAAVPGVNTPARPSTGIHDARNWASGGSGQGVVEVESRIEELASALGMPSKDLASAIAGAVKDYVPPATLSSVSAQAKQTPGGGSEVVDELLGEHHEPESHPAVKAAGGVTGALEGFVGMEEPPAD